MQMSVIAGVSNALCVNGQAYGMPSQQFLQSGLTAIHQDRQGDCD